MLAEELTLTTDRGLEEVEVEEEALAGGLPPAAVVLEVVKDDSLLGGETQAQ